jgi:tetratricopeptide (TPR) repeat protein
MPSPKKHLALLVLLIVLWTTSGMAAGTPQGDSIAVVTDFTYHRGETDSGAKAKALALFGAKLKAVKLAAKYLTHKGLLEHYGKKENEIFCLAVGTIPADVLHERGNDQQDTYSVEIRSIIRNVDFIRAQIEDLEAEKKEAHFAYRREMEQPVMPGIEPGRELSRAYRYIRQQEWRIAIIYLDHLEKKYPSWGDLYLAKAVALYGINDREGMHAALKKACRLDSQEACRELQSFSSEAP